MADPDPPSNQQFLWEAATMMFGQLEGQIARADTEAQLTLAVDAIIVAAITSFLTKGLGATLANATASLPIRAEAAFAIATVVSLLISICFALFATRPKLKAPAGANPFYFGTILSGSRSAKEYDVNFLAQPQQKLIENLLEEVYAKAQIAKRKFNGVSWSVTFLIVALVFWAVAEGLITLVAR